MAEVTSSTGHATFPPAPNSRRISRSGYEKPLKKITERHKREKKMPQGERAKIIGGTDMGLTYQTTPLDELIYTFSATARILEIKTDGIGTLSPQDGGCQVKLKDRPWTIFIPQTEYLKVFVNDRKARARSLVATQHLDDGSRWTVWNPNNGNRYLLTATPDFIHCECDDWGEQFRAFGSQMVCCKHGYAVLSRLGFTTLKDYLKAWLPGGKLRRLGSTLNHKGKTC
jgi:hypothetical protein